MRYAVAATVVAIAAALVVAVAQGGGMATKQRVVIDGNEASFTLTPASIGRPLERDSGSVGFCCWTDHTVVRDGQSADITDGPTMTLTGKMGTLVARNHMEWLDIEGGYEIFTGTWRVVRGTGAYAGATGGGRVAGIQLPSGLTKWRRSGVLTVK
jgi:hypothetical protein